MRKKTWIVIGLFVVIGVLITVSQATGPFYDEGIYATAGLRNFDGYGFGDGYLVWFAGTLLWPTIAGLGFKIAGLVGVRLFALLFIASAYAVTVKTCELWFGPKAAFWTAIALGVSGPVLSLSRLGVYDVPAVLGIAVCFWATTKLVLSQNRTWLPIVSLSYTVAFLSKYPSGLMIFPIAALIVAYRGRKSVLDLGILGFITGALVLAFLLPVRGEAGQWLSWSIANKPTFGATRSTIAFSAVYESIIPFGLASLGVILFARNRVGIILVGCFLIWPMYHITSGNPVSDTKHIVFGFLFGYPLVGLFLSRVWGSHFIRAGIVIAIVAVAAYAGYTQMNQIDHWWPDVRPVVSFLEQEVKPGDQLLINNSWPYIMYLYADGNIKSPWDVFDVYRISHNENNIPLCEFEWLVIEEGSYRWPLTTLDTLQQCGFQKVFDFRSPNIFGLTGDFRFEQKKIHTTVWENPNS